MVKYAPRKVYIKERGRYVELTFLKKGEQENLFATMESEEATPSLSQAQWMKSLSQNGRLDMDTIFAIMTEEKGNHHQTFGA